MLGKLIKHDFRALSRTLFPLQIGIFAAAIVASVFLTINIRLSNMSEAVNDGVLLVFTGISAMLMMIIGFAIAASMLVTLLLICIHYYRNLMGDQGYLTFTLPTTTGRILWSKLITGMIWVVINCAVICVSALIFAVFGTASSGLMNPEVLEVIRGIFTELPSISEFVNVILFILEMLALIVLTLAAMLLQAYFAITVGSRATKHRLLASIGMYLALSMGVNIIRTVVTLCFSVGPVSLLSLATSAEMGVWFLHSVILWNCGLGAGLCVLFFLCTRAMLKNKLNLL